MSVASPLAFWHDAITAQVALDLAATIGLPAALEDRASTTDELRAVLGVDAHGLSVILDALEGIGALARDGEGRWQGSWLLNGTDELRAAFAPSSDRAIGVEHADRAATFYPEVVAGLGEWHAASAARAAAVLARDGLRVLDAGAGSAVWSRAIVEAAVDVSVVAVDLPGVMTATESIVAATPTAPAYELAAADLFEDDLELLGSFDLVLAANLCHLFAADRAATLLRRLAARLRPGGTLAVLDAIPTGTLDEADRAARLYGVHLLNRTTEGRPWSLCDYRRWLTDAGLHDIGFVSVAADSPMSLVTGRSASGAGSASTDDLVDVPAGA